LRAKKTTELEYSHYCLTAIEWRAYKKLENWVFEVKMTGGFGQWGNSGAKENKENGKISEKSGPHTLKEYWRL
jgi:hypothetical protein